MVTNNLPSSFPSHLFMNRIISSKGAFEADDIHRSRQLSGHKCNFLAANKLTHYLGLLTKLNTLSRKIRIICKWVSGQIGVGVYDKTDILTKLGMEQNLQGNLN